MIVHPKKPINCSVDQTAWVSRVRRKIKVRVIGLLIGLCDYPTIHDCERKIKEVHRRARQVDIPFEDTPVIEPVD
jgi:hypothetical protein